MYKITTIIRNVGRMLACLRCTTKMDLPLSMLWKKNDVEKCYLNVNNLFTYNV